jgi:hypothetical protein
MRLSSTADGAIKEKQIPLSNFIPSLSGQGIAVLSFNKASFQRNIKYAV